MRITRMPALVAAAALSTALVACQSDDDENGSDGDADTAAAAENDEEDTLVIYSGRDEELVGLLIDQLEESVGTEVDVRYGDTPDLAAQLLEEGSDTEADLFFSQDAGALGALAKADLLATLEQDTTELVDEEYRDTEDRWVATSARARVLAYDPTQVAEDELPNGVDDLLDPRFEGMVGYPPTNAGFHAFVTALRVDRGDDGARQWLEEFDATDPETYENNRAVLEAVDRGEVALGLVNHYYWYESVAEQGEDAVNAQIHYLNTDDPGALINVAGIGVLEPSADSETAHQAAEFLLSEQAQQFFADETAEYTVIDQIASNTHDIPDLEELQGHQIDLNDLDTLDETLALLDEVGIT